MIGYSAMCLMAIMALSEGMVAQRTLPIIDLPTTAPLPSALEIRLSAAQSSVAVGENIFLRVQVVNRTSEAFAVSDLTPWDAVHVTLTEEGRVIAPSSRYVAPYHYKFPGQVVVDPEQAFTYRWMPMTGSGQPAFYYPLSYWGYSQRLAPGRYSIVATPILVAARQHGRWLNQDRKLQSNAVNVTVTP